jgi:hypothetical protein
MESQRNFNNLDDDEWQSWYCLSMEERWREIEKLWQFYLSVGGSLDLEPDSQSPFDLAKMLIVRLVNSGPTCTPYGAI